MTTARRRRPDPASRTRICNVVPSRDTDKDWRFEQSVDAGVLGAAGPLPREVDLREDWWTINNQEDTGSCVGWATADGVVRWHMVKAGKLRKPRMLSPRHVWMASKETDSITERPESFIEEAGTTLKAALDVARKHGVALEEDLPFHVGSKMYVGPEATFYARASRRKIASYFNLELNLTNWKTWLAQQGPILAALQVDASWDDATSNGGKIDTFDSSTVRGGHAIAVVGYRRDGRFIVRNSWDTTWGDNGFGYVKPAYVKAAFFAESYGVSM
jgi:C1A family cysteine protease